MKHPFSFFQNNKTNTPKKELRFPLLFIGTLALIGLFSDFLANERPLFLKTNDAYYFPAFQTTLKSSDLHYSENFVQDGNWTLTNPQFVLYPIIPYSPHNLDFKNAHSKSPFDEQTVNSIRWRHWLGTDFLGRDVLSGLIHGIKTSLVIGVLAVFFSLLIGVSIGALAGFFGDVVLKIPRISLFLLVALIPIAIYWAFNSRGPILEEASNKSSLHLFIQLIISLFLIFIAFFMAIFSPKLCPPKSRLVQTITLPVDAVLSRIIELFNTIPFLIVILALVSIFKPSLFLIVMVISTTSWTFFAKLVRAETFKIRKMDYMEAADALGFSHARKIIRHILPNAISPIIAVASFGIASSILAESTLSFLGIGLPPEAVTWGSILAESKNAPTDWWLSLFPGMLIFLTIYAFNKIGEILKNQRFL